MMRNTALQIAILGGLLFSAAVMSEENNVATACGHHDYPPWNWVENGRIVGACAESATEVFAKAGLTLDLTFVGPWKRCQQEIRLGRVDINICSFINSERESYSQFTKTPMGYNEIAIFHSADRQFHFNTWQDLKHRIIGIVRGVSMGAEFDAYLRDHARLTTTNNYRSLFRMLHLHRLDAVPFGRYSGKTYLRSLGLSTEIVDEKIPVLTGNLYFSMSKQSKYLHVLPKVDAQLKTRKYAQRLEQLLEKYSYDYAPLQKDKHRGSNDSND